MALSSNDYIFLIKKQNDLLEEQNNLLRTQNITLKDQYAMLEEQNRLLKRFAEVGSPFLYYLYFPYPSFSISVASSCPPVVIIFPSTKTCT